MLEQAKLILKEKGFISMALLRRKLKISWDRAEKIIEQMKKENLIKKREHSMKGEK